MTCPGSAIGGSIRGPGASRAFVLRSCGIIDAPMAARILIVDDHEGFRGFARALLVESGYDVIGEAADAASALSAARDLRPDIVLLDVQLPDADGFSVARALSVEPDPPRVVLVSSRAARAYGGRIAASPACGFLTKDALSGPALAATLA